MLTSQHWAPSNKFLPLNPQAGKSVVTVTTKTAFDAQTPCRRVWEDLMDDGKLSSTTGISNGIYLQSYTVTLKGQLTCDLFQIVTSNYQRNKCTMEKMPSVFFFHFIAYMQGVVNHPNQSRPCVRQLLRQPRYHQRTKQNQSLLSVGIIQLSILDRQKTSTTGN